MVHTGKRIVVLLLVLALLMTLGSPALAKNRFSKGDKVKLKANAFAYTDRYKQHVRSFGIKKGSLSVVRRTYGDSMVELYLDPLRKKTAWFEAGLLSRTGQTRRLNIGGRSVRLDVVMEGCKGRGSIIVPMGISGDSYGPYRDSGTWLGQGGSRVTYDTCKQLVVTRKADLLKDITAVLPPSGSVKKDAKLTYLRRWTIAANGFTPYYAVRYRGSKLFISARDCKPVLSSGVG